jgi:fatty acid desaturase
MADTRKYEEREQDKINAAIPQERWRSRARLLYRTAALSAVRGAASALGATAVSAVMWWLQSR